VSNELGCHNGRCWCDVSAAAFRRWLAERYGDIEKLNDAWGTAFWSQHYTTFDEVLPPRITPAVPNPTQQLDFARFSSDALLDYYRAERDVLRQHSTVPVTTNFMIMEHRSEQDYFAWASDMDVVSQDHYLDHRLPHPRAEQAFADDLRAFGTAIIERMGAAPPEAAFTAGVIVASDLAGHESHGLRRLPEGWSELWCRVLRGASREAIEQLALRLLEHAGARARRAEVQDDLRAIKRFFDDEASALAAAVTATAYAVYPVPQRHRDRIFLQYRSRG
jgi:hypothetical protein